MAATATAVANDRIPPEVDEDLDLGSTPMPDLNRVGTHFLEQEPPTAIDSNYYVLGSIGRLCNEVDDITLAESNSTRTAPGSNSPEPAPITRVPTGFQRDAPVFSWESRTIVSDGSSLDALLQKRQKAGSSLAPQSSSDPSEDDRSEAPSVGQFRPGTDLMQCPVIACERTFKWKKNLHHHIRDKHPTDAHGLSVMRIQPAHVGAAHNGFRLQSIAIAPHSHVVAIPAGGEPGLRCPECGKAFSRKGDLVHHKRYHTRSTDRPYKCDQCGQGFIHHKDLARHMPRHTGQRSFQCPFQDCHKNYTRKDNLNRHMRHDHGGLGASGEVWTGVEQAAAQDFIHEQVHHEEQPPMLPVIAEAQAQNIRAESMSSEDPNNHHFLPHSSYRETTPSLGKRPADDLDRLSIGIKPKRKPKERWAHRLGCPFRKCRLDLYTTENGFRVCETTPHEFIIRLIEHMKRNHELYVCGECFLGYTTPDSMHNHKLTHPHCGKCYLSFPNQASFAEHTKSCMAVEASTQEEIWQIMYETLCGDGVRHNPSFDEDGPVNQTIESNNRVRMQFIAQQPLLQGQVPPLVKLASPSSAGNGQPPPTSQADSSQPHQQLVTLAEAANATQMSANGSHTSSPRATANEAQLLVEAQQRMISMLQTRVADEEHARIAAETRANNLSRVRALDVFQSAVRQLVASIRTPSASLVKPRYASGWVEEMSPYYGEMDGDSTVALAPTRGFLDDPPAAMAAPMFLPLTMQPRTSSHVLACPSLTSESTLPTQRGDFGMTQTPSFASQALASTNKDGGVQDHFYLWGGNSTCSCLVCGGEVDGVEDRYCGACQNRF